MSPSSNSTPQSTPPSRTQTKENEVSAMAVATPVASEIATHATSAEGRKKLVCKDALTPHNLVLVKQQAERLIEDLVANPAIFDSYGTVALGPLNQLADL